MFWYIIFFRNLFFKFKRLFLNYIRKALRKLWDWKLRLLFWFPMLRFNEVITSRKFLKKFASFSMFDQFSLVSFSTMKSCSWLELLNFIPVSLFEVFDTICFEFLPPFLLTHVLRGWSISMRSFVFSNTMIILN